MSNPNNPYDSKDDLGGMARDIVRELKATSDLVRDAALQGKDELLHYVTESMRSSRYDRSQRGGFNPSSYNYCYSYNRQQSYGQTPPKRERTRERSQGWTPAQSYTPQPRRKKVRRVSWGRWGLWLGGAMPFYIASFIFLILTVVGFLNVDLPLVFPVLCLSMFAAGSVPAFFAIRKSRKEKLYTRYLSAVGTSGNMRIRDLAALMRRDYGPTLQDVQDMVERGYFGTEARVDVAKGLLILDPSAPLAEEEPPRSAAPEKETEAEPPKQAETQTPDSYDAMLQQLRELNERIEDETMSSRIYRIEAVARATASMR